MFGRRELLVAGLATFLPISTKAAEARVISVPIELSPLGSPLIAVMLDGKGPFGFMVDTGATHSGVKDQLARDIGLKPVGSQQFSGYGGVQTVKIYEVQDVIFGGSLRQSRVYFTGLTKYSLTDGLMAAGFITSYSSHLDYDTKRIDIYPDGPPPVDGFSAIDAHETNRGGSSRIMARVVLDGMNLNLMVDTGASTTILFPQTVKRLKLWDHYPEFNASSAKGVTGKVSNVRHVVVDTFNLGAHTLKNVEVSLSDPSGFGGDNIDGLIGINVIRQFNWLFLGHANIQVAPNGHFNTPWTKGEWPIFKS